MEFGGVVGLCHCQTVSLLLLLSLSFYAVQEFGTPGDKLYVPPLQNKHIICLKPVNTVVNEVSCFNSVFS